MGDEWLTSDLGLLVVAGLCFANMMMWGAFAADFMSAQLAWGL